MDNVSYSAATSFPFNFQSSQEGTAKPTAAAHAQQLLPDQRSSFLPWLCSQLDAQRSNRDLSQVQSEKARTLLHVWPCTAIARCSFSSGTSCLRWD